MSDDSAYPANLNPLSSGGVGGPTVRFFHRSGHANVRPDLDALIESGSRSIRAAVCFFSRAGYILLSKHALRLNLPDSYLVASVDSPTSLNAMAALHKLAPGHVYIHLGGKTPEEPRVGRSLMHSKVFLAVDNKEYGQLWVGSHNLTAMAVEGGNFEAGLTFAGSTSSPVIEDAIAHLEACRNTAEPFNPRDLDRYKEIQRRHQRGSDWDLERYVVVVHAEAAQWPTTLPFVIHIQIEPTDYDRYFRVDRRARLFLHAPGALVARKPVDYRKASLWTGEITAVVRTERHPKNRGTSARFSRANYDVDVPGPNGVPAFVASGLSQVQAKTQVVARFDGQEEPGAEVYSQSSASPVVNVLDAADALEMHPIENDMLECFTPESLAEHCLLYRPVVGVKQELHIAGYEETLRSHLPDKFITGRMLDADECIHYMIEEPKRPLDPFIFVSTYVARPKRAE